MDLMGLFKRLRKKSKRLWRGGWSDRPQDVAVLSGFGTMGEKDKRKEAKPKDVMKELFSGKAKVDLTNLDEKIKAIRKRRDFMDYELDLSVGDENRVIEWLKARKKYPKYGQLFNWHTTTQPKVDKLLKKYQLKVGSVMEYKRCIPVEAIDEMERFTKSCRRVTASTPIIKIIADADETKKDPILLGQSPFGNFFYVLGAWDKEVEIMDELYG